MSGPTLPRVDEIDLDRPMRAHDVRKLRPCVCGGIGYGPHMLEIVNYPGVEPGRYHGVCAVRALTREQLLALPSEETGKLKLRDVGVDLMRALLDREVDEAVMQTLIVRSRSGQ